MRARIVLLSAIAVAAATPGLASDLDALLTKVEAAYGGTEAIERLASYRAEGKTTSQMLETTGDFSREYRF